MHKRDILAGALACILFLAAWVAAAQEASDKFRISVADGAISGTEEYRIEKTDQGYRITSTTKLSRSGQPMELKQEQTLAADGTLIVYTLRANVAGREQFIEARREGEQVHLQAVAGGQSRSRSVAMRPRTLVLDNLVVSHYQVLLDLLGDDVSGKEDWWLLVPQPLAAVNGKLAVAGEENGTLHGESLRLRKYELQMGGTQVEFWATADTRRLMRVAVPLQRVELVRDGFTLEPPAPPAQPEEKINFRERTLTFPSAGLNFPATLCLPKEARAPVPVVVLVHGSGPHDRDETIGPNKPFRDLAHGLAETGIASLRYDKRTYAFPGKINRATVTVEEEVIADAVAALEHARGLPETDAEGVFLAGHSLGATLAPFIAKRTPWLRGVILLAALARPIDETIFDQISYRGRVAGQAAEEVAQRVEELKRAFARVRSGEAPDSETVFFAPALYWRDFMRYDLTAALRELPLPVLVLQGGKDYQVTREDYDLIRVALAHKPARAWEAHLFPNLNHLFIRVEGESTGAEYGQPGKMDSAVIQTIAAWMRAQAAKQAE